MGVVTAKPDMAKRDDTAAKIDAKIVRAAKIVAAYRDITLAEYLSELLRPLVFRDLKAEQARQIAVDEGPPAPPPPADRPGGKPRRGGKE